MIGESKIAVFSEAALSPEIGVEIDCLARDGGPAVVVLDENHNIVSSSNDNSICQTLYGSSEFGSNCDQYCGSVFSNATQPGKIFSYKCFAGLHCRAAAFHDGERRLVAIVGRAFLSVADYREARVRAIEGEWQRLDAEELFGNILLTDSTTALELMASRAALINNKADAAFVLHPAASVAADARNAADKKKNPIYDAIKPEVQAARTAHAECVNCGEFNPVDTNVCGCGYWLDKQMVLPGPSAIDDLNRERQRKAIQKLIICALVVIALTAAAYWAGFIPL